MAEPGGERGKKARRSDARLRGGVKAVRFRDVAVKTPPKEIAEIGRRVAELEREGRHEEDQPRR
jgi:hypothetical protein